MTHSAISIIIATRNREAILWESVSKAVMAITGKNAEIIIVNDGDKALVPPAEYEERLQCFDNPSRGVSSARNFGAARAKGELLFFIDDDMWINPEVLDWIHLHMADENSYTSVFNINWEYPPVLSQKLRHSKVGKYLLNANYNCMWGRMHQHGEQPVWGLYLYHSIASCSLIMTKAIFSKLGGYNEQLIFQGEDIDLSNRLGFLSVPIFAVFDITLFHNHQDRLDIAGFLARLGNGYSSEFQAVKAGVIKPLSNRAYVGSARKLFDFFYATEAGWMFLYNSIPTNRLFTPITNKLVGLLAGLARYKEWKKVFCNEKHTII